MDKQIRQLLIDIRELEVSERALVQKREALSKLRRGCSHDWSKPEPKSIIRDFHISGDAEGTMGVDRQLPCDIPSKTDRWWERTCKKCGLTGKTTQTRPTGSEPVF